ncbi:STM3941 family protein [Mucilaginibacter ginsenosidivorax]|uniref:Uncharacterized protein n=1 Tax=Mucilaginibacter ginsenosidivorax TaxID=862126 RepID=A0A5B8VZ43_9SPHI|nr:STM3941 family protein [Mucilaginibacter ginsenosidivorax]QEC76744.1 hypothetical protein FSB76_12585 [Mucilaginibacter ginsenosidivorax]
MLFGILGSLAFVLGSIWIYSIADTQTDWPPFVLKVVSIMGLLFFGLAIIMGLKKLIDKYPGLIINDHGILNASGFGKPQFIPWENVTSVRSIETEHSKLIQVFINNAEEVISKQSRWKQKLMRMSQSRYGTPISINCVILKIDPGSLLLLLIKRQSAVNAFTSPA